MKNKFTCIKLHLLNFSASELTTKVLLPSFVGRCRLCIPMHTGNDDARCLDAHSGGLNNRRLVVYNCSVAHTLVVYNCSVATINHRLVVCNCSVAGILSSVDCIPHSRRLG